MAKKTDVSERQIVLIGGESGGGKSFFISNIPNALIYDTDIGGGAAYLDARIRRNGSMRVDVASYGDVKADIRARNQSGELKKFSTVVIDHLTVLQQEAAIRHNPSLGQDYGRANEAATKEWRQLREFIRNMDFNLVCTLHLKAKYENDKPVGFQSDAAKNIDADFGIVLHLKKKPGGGYPSMASVQKWRRDPEDPLGPVPTTFPFVFEEFCKIAATDLKGERGDVAVASPELLAEYKAILSKVNVDPKILDRWSKVDAEDLNAKQVQERIDYCKKLVG